MCIGTGMGAAAVFEVENMRASLSVDLFKVNSRCHSV
jgi:hypothetical protein